MKTNSAVIILIPLTLVLALGLSGCTNTRIPSQANMPVDHINIQHRIDVANLLFKQHDYHESLVQWKILRSIQPDNAQYKNRIRVLEALIKRRLKIHLRNANNALVKQDIKTAEWEFLTVLALDPQHSQATKMLKRIEASNLEKKQTRKTERLLQKRLLAQQNAHEIDSEPEEDNEQSLFYLELGIELFDKKDWRGSIREVNKYLATNPADPKAISLLTTSHIHLSKIFEDRGHLEPAIQHIEDVTSLSKSNNEKYSEKLLHLKRKLSANYYIEGVKTYRDNIDQAIVYWRRAIAINPNNEKAKIRLRKAEKMKEKLSDIQPKN